jgi:hypothetical protein
LKKDRWLAVTAGVGAPQFEEAAQRVYDDLQKSGIVDKVVKVITKDLPEVCPEVSRLYVDLMNVDTRGYGYMCWKAEVVKAAVDGKWGEFDGVIWIDAGCEVSINHVSDIMFNRFQAYARKYGVACFTLDTLEIEYTKRDLFEIFPRIEPTKSGKQIQSTWFFLYGDEGKKIAQEWFNVIMCGTQLLELTPSKRTEYPQFIENRYDQSAFSLVCKSNKVPVMDYSPTAGWGSFFSYVKGHFHPIWTSRNRFGQSKKKLSHKLLELIFRT